MSDPPAYLRFSLGRPVTVSLGVVTVTVLGVIALFELPLQMFPSGFSGNSLHVFIPVREVVPSQLERTFVPEVEDGLRSVPDLLHLYTRISRGSVRFDLQFGPEADVTELTAEVRDRLERVRHLFPEGTDRYFLWRFNPDVDMPVLLFSVSFPPEVEDIWLILEEVIRPSLESLPSVGRVDLWGYIPRHVAILLDSKKTAALRVRIDKIIRALSEDNQNFGIGRVRCKGEEIPVRVLGRFNTLKDFESFPVRHDLPLSRIAKVSWERRTLDFRPSYLDGRRNLAVAVLKTSTANTVQTCREVEAHLARLFGEHQRLKGITYNVFFNQGEEISRSLSKLGQSGLWGALFATAILFLFLRNLRLTAVVVLAIPLSVLFALLTLYFMHGSLNLFSMAGMTIVVGMLVDNAIVVLERIFRFREEGADRVEAAWRGTHDVAVAVITATATTVAAFLPLLFMARERQARVAVRELGTPVCFALAGSLVVALVVVPLATRFLSGRAKRRRGAQLGWIAGFYTHACAWVLDHRFEAALCFAGFLLCGPVLLQGISFVQQQDRFHDAPSIRVQFPGGTSWSRAEEAFNRLLARFDEKWRKDHDIEHIWHRFDRSGGIMRFFVRRGSRWTKEKIEKALAQRLPQIAGVVLTVGTIRLSAEDLRTEDVRVALSGFRGAVVRDSAEKLKTYLQERFPGVQIHTSWEEEEPELTVGLRSGFAARRGIAPSQVAGLVSWALRGARLRDFSTPDAEIPVWVHWQQVDQDVAALHALRLPVGEGATIPLTALTTLHEGKPTLVIRRENGRATAVVVMRFPLQEAQQAEKKVREAVRSFALPPGCEIRVSSGREVARAAQEELFSALQLSVVLVFLLMGILFESFILPLAVLASVPSAFVGSLGLLRLLGYPLDMMGLVGGLVLVGIVVNNAIVLVDAIQKHRHRGLPRREAALAGVRYRLRPIWMTAMSTICGLLPMALADPRSGGASWRTLSVVVAGGLAVSTLVTLLAVPLFYSLLDDLSTAVAQAFRWAFAGARAAGAGGLSGAGSAIPGSTGR